MVIYLYFVRKRSNEEDGAACGRPKVAELRDHRTSIINKNLAQDIVMLLIVYFSLYIPNHTVYKLFGYRPASQNTEGKEKGGAVAVQEPIPKREKRLVWLNITCFKHYQKVYFVIVPTLLLAEILIFFLNYNQCEETMGYLTSAIGLASLVILVLLPLLKSKGELLGRVFNGFFFAFQFLIIAVTIFVLFVRKHCQIKKSSDH